MLKLIPECNWARRRALPLRSFANVTNAHEFRLKKVGILKQLSEKISQPMVLKSAYSASTSIKYIRRLILVQRRHK